jgi:hypothetical protein
LVGWFRVMRFCFPALLCAVVGGCAVLGQQDPPPRELSLPPAELALERNVASVAKTAKWSGAVEASPVRQAHLLAPADWIVCAQSGARDLSPPYALFFNGDTMVHYRIAVEIDDCRRAPYAIVLVSPPVSPPAAAVGGPLVLGHRP